MVSQVCAKDFGGVRAKNTIKENRNKQNLIYLFTLLALQIVGEIARIERGFQVRFKPLSRGRLWSAATCAGRRGFFGLS